MVPLPTVALLQQCRTWRIGLPVYTARGVHQAPALRIACMDRLQRVGACTVPQAGEGLTIEQYRRECHGISQEDSQADNRVHVDCVHLMRSLFRDAKKNGGDYKKHDSDIADDKCAHVFVPSFQCDSVYRGSHQALQYHIHLAMRFFLVPCWPVPCMAPLAIPAHAACRTGLAHAPPRLPMLARSIRLYDPYGRSHWRAILFRLACVFSIA